MRAEAVEANGNGCSAGGAGTSSLGVASDRNASNECDEWTRSLRNGRLGQNRASTVFRIEQWSSTRSGPLPAGTQGDTTKVGTRTPYGVATVAGTSKAVVFVAPVPPA